MDFETLCWASLVMKTVRIVQNPSLECYVSVRFKQLARVSESKVGVKVGASVGRGQGDA